MEDALVLFEFRLVYCLCFSVLILVLMEDALVLNLVVVMQKLRQSS